ncbi:hypothetical protein AURDEDRAFT_63090 [Auricularia subglabra TFB-10046 SS5]|nr:hypothetical protein AURDEDRAFT_63090 [Auricularia subglabra TFB-10046 SS5]
MFARKLLLLVGLLVTSAYGIPEPRTTAAAAGEKLVVIKTEDTPTGKLVTYGTAGGISDAAVPGALACGSNDVVCDSSNVPSSDACSNLLNVLNSNGGVQLDPTARSICQSANGFQCCVSWASNVSGLHVGDLVSAASKSYNSCVVNGRSARTLNTNLNGVCTVQCLSNRPDGCN